MFVWKSQTVQLEFGILSCPILNCRKFSGYKVANEGKHTGELEYYQIIVTADISMLSLERNSVS